MRARLEWSRAAVGVAMGVALALALASCDATKADEGRDATMRVAGAQFVRGEMPGDGGGPKVATVVLVSTAVTPGVTGKSCTGALDANATAAALMLGGDLGYWILPAGAADVSSPGFPGYKTELSFATSIAPGRHDLLVAAVDDAGRFGAPRVTTLTASALAGARPSGALVVSLTWSNVTDLDLHLVDPTGVEVFNRNPSSYQKPPPGSAPPPPDFVPSGGVLDRDAQASCIPEGLSQEDVVYAEEPPRGHYVVRVDTASMCGQASAYWRAEAFFHGASLGAAEGIATEADVRFSHDRGAGVLALEFDVP